MRSTKLTLFVLAAAILLFGSCRKEITPINQADQATCANQPPPPPPAPVIAYCGSVTVALMGDNNASAGSVTIGNDGINLYVTYNLTGNYSLKKTRLYVGSLAGLPLKNNGNANSSQFPYSASHNSNVTTFTYTIPLSSLSSPCYIVSAYAELNSIHNGDGDDDDDNGDGDNNHHNNGDDHGYGNGDGEGGNHDGDGGHAKKAWANGTRINPNSNDLGMYVNWCNASCVETPPEK